VRIKLIVAGAAIAAAGLVVRLVWMNKLTVYARSESWSASGAVPWGKAARSVNDEVPVVLWRAIRGGYCYDAVFSEDLRRRLSTSHASIVVVDYNVFTDFGRAFRHTVRAVDGIRIDDNARQDGGMMEVPDLNGPAENCETWQPSDRKRDGG
jgi:hypothetical protein